MKTPKLIHHLYAISLIIIILIPPFYGLDTQSEAKIHVFMGYYQLWNKPQSIDVYYALLMNGKLSSEEGIPIDIDSKEFKDQYQSKFNTVRFVFNLFLISLVYTILRLFHYYKWKENKEMQN